MFANRISSSTSCSIWLPETSPPSSARGLLRHHFQSCNTSPLVDETGEWATLYGIGPEGAVLVRPDGHVAWRTQASASEENLESAMRSILDRRMASVLP